MRNFSDRRSFGKKRSFSDRGGDRPMFDAICSQCGQQCQVPFKPTSGKAILCNHCFRKDDTSYQPKRFTDRKNSDDNWQLKAISDKLDKILEILSTKNSE